MTVPQRFNRKQVVWFLAPTVPLAIQQKEAVRACVPAIKIRLLTGPDGVDRWRNQEAWDAAILDMRIIVSTPAVLADALEHRFVKMGKLALLVFDEGMGIPKRTGAIRLTAIQRTTV